MLTNYKFAYILRKDDINIGECGVRFYEGEVSTKPELNTITQEIKDITRYRISRRLRGDELNHLDGKRATEVFIDDLVIYTKENFGNITTDDELRLFLNSELKKDSERSPQKEQNTLDITKVK